VKNHDAAVDDRALEHPRNSVCGLDPEFEQAATHRTGVRHSEVWSELLHSLGIADKPGNEPGRQIEDFRLDAIAVEGD
jgi:hypothetical protein